MDDAGLLTVEEVARRLALSRSTVYGLLAAGRIRSIRVGRARRIQASAVREFVESLTEST